MAGVIKTYFPQCTCFLGVLFIIYAVVHLITSIDEIVAYKSWAKYFFEEDNHIIGFAYTHATVYFLVIMGALSIGVSFKANLCRLISLKILLLLTVAFSVTIPILLFNRQPQVLKKACTDFENYIQVYQKAKSTFCQSDCQCYIYEGYNISLPNVTIFDQSKAQKVINCPTWIPTQLDKIIQSIERTVGCSGWCDKTQVFYFSSNQDSHTDENGTTTYYRKHPKGPCFDKSQGMIKHLFWKFPIGSSITIGILCLFMLVLTTQALLMKRKNIEIPVF